jgi:hypothetical protein
MVHLLLTACLSISNGKGNRLLLNWIDCKISFSSRKCKDRERKSSKGKMCFLRNHCLSFTNV